MINNLRKLSKSGLTKVIIVILLLSFLFFGIGDIFRSNIQDSFLSVGKESFSKAYIDEYARREKNYIIANQENISESELAQIDFTQIALQKITQRNLLLQEAEELGLNFTDKDILREIIQQDFLKIDGEFSVEQYNFFLKQNNLSESEYIEYLRKDKKIITLQNITNFVDKYDFPNIAKIVSQIENQDRFFDFYKFSLPATYKLEINDSDLEQYYVENKNLFELPEQRIISYLNLNCASQIAEVAIDENDIKDEYARIKNESIANAERNISFILLENNSDIAQIEKDLTAGTSLENIANKYELNLNNFASAKLSDLPPEFHNDIIALNEQQNSKILKNDFGSYIFRVNAINNLYLASYELQKDEIKAELAQTQACALALEKFNAIEDKINSGVTINEIAQQYKLDLKENISLTQIWELKEELNLAEDKLLELYQDIFSNSDFKQIYNKDLGDFQFIIYQISNKIPAYQPPLKEIKEKVLARYKGKKIYDILFPKANEFIQQNLSGEKVTIDKNFILHKKNLSLKNNINDQEIFPHYQDITTITPGQFSKIFFDKNTNSISFIKLNDISYPSQADPNATLNNEILVRNLIKDILSSAYNENLSKKFPIKIKNEE